MKTNRVPVLQSNKKLTVYTSSLSHHGNIIHTAHVTVGNDRDADAILDELDGFIVDRLAPLLLGAAMHADPGCTRLLRPLTHFNCLPIEQPDHIL